MISALVLAQEGEDALSEEELIGMVAMLIFAGHETTTNLLGNGMLALLSHPAQLAELRSQPELMPLRRRAAALRGACDDGRSALRG